MKELLKLRESLDGIDESLIKLIAERFRVTAEVGRLKKERNLPSSDPDREARQMERITGLAEEVNLDPEVARKVLRLLIDEAVKNHNRLKDS